LAHHGSVFSPWWRLVPRHGFETLAGEHHVGAPLRRMSRWLQVVALLAAPLTGRQSLRDIEGRLKTQQAQLYHLGGKPVPRRSLGRLNAEQPYTLFERCSSGSPRPPGRPAPGIASASRTRCSRSTAR
jgi:hypothetical protein